MSNRRKAQRNELFSRTTAMTMAHGKGYTLREMTGRTIHGTVLTDWMRSIATDGVMPDCGHAVPWLPAVLCTDDPDPMIRCGVCMQALRSIGDDRICHLCQRPSEIFREFTIEGTGQLVIVGNACEECFADIFRGRPSLGLTVA